MWDGVRDFTVLLNSQVLLLLALGPHVETHWLLSPLSELPFLSISSILSLPLALVGPSQVSKRWELGQTLNELIMSQGSELTESQDPTSGPLDSRQHRVMIQFPISLGGPDASRRMGLAQRKGTEQVSGGPGPRTQLSWLLMHLFFPLSFSYSKSCLLWTKHEINPSFSETHLLCSRHFLHHSRENNSPHELTA